MSKRFIWNFEINQTSPIHLPSINDALPENMHWESRYFWPEHKPIVLNGLDDSFLALSRYTIKQRHDKYVILDKFDLNLKFRRDALIYKPKQQQTPIASAYGKKIKYDSISLALPPDSLSIEVEAFRQMISEPSNNIEVEKEAVLYKFPTTPKLKIELARINIKNKIFYSFSIESPVLAWVEYLSHHVISSKTPMDYVTFIKSILKDRTT
jgi:hypothetical protein